MTFASHPATQKHAQYLNPAFIGLLNLMGYGRVFVRAQDVWLWDSDDKRYLDALAGFGAVNPGHNHPRLVARLQQFLQSEALNLYHIGPSPHAAELAESLAKLLSPPLEISLFSNSGAEAVEAAIKLARAATRRPNVIYCHSAYHGTNLGTLSVSDKSRLRQPFEPLLPGCIAVPFGDPAALEAALADKRAGSFVVEPIQGEGGVRLPPSGYLQQAQELCQRHGTLLVFDEVQTGCGRTGSLFAFEMENVVPDILVLAKSLGGGIASIGATLTSRALHAKAYGSMERFDLHSSTFGGNSFAAVAATETLQILQQEALPQNAAARGEQLLAGIRQRLAGHPFVTEVRGRGLMIGIEIGPGETGWTSQLAPGLVSLASEKLIGQWLALRLLESGVICQPAAHAWNVLKLLPPLTIKAEQIDELIRIVGNVFDECQNLAKVLAQATSRLMRQSVMPK